MNCQLLVAASAFGLFAAGSAMAQDIEIATWAGFRKAATSFTFDDGPQSNVDMAMPMFDKYGYKATFNIVTNWANGGNGQNGMLNWDGVKALAADGHEIASHSDSHPNGTAMPDGEVATSKGTIEGKVTQDYGCITLAYPNCIEPQGVLQHYIAGRICGNGQEVMGKDGPSNWSQVPAYMTGSTGSYTNTNAFTGAMKQAVNKGGWVMFLTHGFTTGTNGYANYSPTDANAIEGALKWASENDKDIWVAPFRNVTMYIKERKAASIDPQDGGSADKISFKLTHNIADNISKYDYPLSIRVKTDWANVEVSQEGAKLESKVDGGYVYFDAVPNAGLIVVKNGASAPTSSSSEEGNSSSSGTLENSSSSNDPMGVASVPNNFQFAVFSSDGYITVSGAQGMNVTVFNSLGHKLRSTRALGCEQKVFTGAKGVYIVKVGGQTFKVKL